MELLDLLESRVSGLVGEVEKLREENKRILAASEESAAAHRAALAENARLQEGLTQEQHLKDEVLKRIDALLARIKVLDTNV